MATKKTTAQKPAVKKAVAKTAAKTKKPSVKQPVNRSAKKPVQKPIAATKAAQPAPVSPAVKMLRMLRRPAVVAVLLIAVVGAVVWALAGNGDSATTPVSQEAYRQELQAQVEQSDGTPNTGRDPASQGQNSLAAAASKPAGAGLRTDTPAAAAEGDHSGHDVTHGDVYGDAKGTGIGSNGCFIDYGVQGEQCVPSHAAGSDKVLNCAEVRKYFKDGVKVTGTDRFHLDHDGDKIACGPGEVSH